LACLFAFVLLKERKARKVQTMNDLAIFLFCMVISKPLPCGSVVDHFQTLTQHLACHFTTLTTKDTKYQITSYEPLKPCLTHLFIINIVIALMNRECPILSEEPRLCNKYQMLHEYLIHCRQFVEPNFAICAYTDYVDQAMMLD
jgi:hypothetical protein